MMVLLLLAWVLFLYRETAAAMVTIWARSETFTHGFLVPPIVLWLIWRRRGEIAATMPQPMGPALIFVAGAALVWLVGDSAAVNSVTQLAFVAILVLVVPAALGMAVTRHIIFPLGFLFFCVPIGEFLMPQLMEGTANFTVLALRLSGIPVYREGLQFVIPSGNWSVVEACSGVRYLIASLTVGTLFAYLNYHSLKRRVLFIFVSALVPVVANWLRAYLIVMLGHLSGNKLAAGVDHLIYGWLFFGVVIMLMFVVGARWAEPELPFVDRGAQGSRQHQGVSRWRLWGISTIYALVVALPYIWMAGLDHGKQFGAVGLDAPEVLSTNWRLAATGEIGFKPAFQNPTVEINKNYFGEGQNVGLYIGYYRDQNYSSKLVSSDNALVTSKDPQWALVGRSERDVNLEGTVVRSVFAAELRRAAPASHAQVDRLVVYQIFWINGTLTTSDYLAKVYSAWYRLTGRGDDSAVVIAYTAKDQPGGGEAVLDSFLSSNYSAINKILINAQQRK